MPGLATMQHALDVVAAVILDHGQDWRRDGVEIPYIMGDILEVADIFAGIQIDRHQTIGVEVVARTQRSVEIGRRVADDEIDPVRFQIHGRVLPDTAAERGVRVALRSKGSFLRLDVTLHVAAGRILGGPDTD